MWSKRAMAFSLLHRLCIWGDRTKKKQVTKQLCLCVYVCAHVFCMVSSVTTTPPLEVCVSSGPDRSPLLSGAAESPLRQSSGVSPCAPPPLSMKLYQTYAGPPSYAHTPLHTDTSKHKTKSCWQLNFHTVQNDVHSRDSESPTRSNNFLLWYCEWACHPQLLFL